MNIEIIPYCFKSLGKDGLREIKVRALREINFVLFFFLGFAKLNIKKEFEIVTLS